MIVSICPIGWRISGGVLPDHFLQNELCLEKRGNFNRNEYIIGTIYDLYLRNVFIYDRHAVPSASMSVWREGLDETSRHCR